jgi:hypothetical protein
MSRTLVSSLVVAVLFNVACGEPPDREIQQALGAIDAARAAGAEQYAREELTAAEVAVEQAHDAIAAGDLRLALNHALDGRERARNAAMLAADRKVAAGVEADHVLAALAAALTAAQTSLRAAESAQTPPGALEGPQTAIMDGERLLQEARAAFQKGDYSAVVELDLKIAPLLAAAVKDLTEATPARQ